MKKLWRVFAVALVCASCSSQAAPDQAGKASRGLAAPGAKRHDHPRRLGHRARPRQDRRRRRVRHDLRAGRRRLQPRRDELLNSLGRLAEAEGETEIYRDLRMKLFIDPDELKAQYAAEPGVAEDADERLGRRPELLPLHASRK